MKSRKEEWGLLRQAWIVVLVAMIWVVATSKVLHAQATRNR